jgi:hypothetical protein
MTEKISADELQWLREIALADNKVERRIPQLCLAKLLKFGLVESYDMLTLRISLRGWKCLNITAPARAGRTIPYALAADANNMARLQLDKA